MGEDVNPLSSESPPEPIGEETNLASSAGPPDINLGALRVALRNPVLPESFPEEIASPVIETESPAEEAAQGGETPASAELLAWKNTLRQDFEKWLATIDELPREDADELSDLDEPDLYSFYEQLAAANVETRKANRRTAEAFSQWGEALGRFAGDLDRLREVTSRLAATTETTESFPRAACLVLVELLDRLHRLAAAFNSPPPKVWWRNDTEWRRAWETQRQGLDILTDHFQDLLKKEGVERLAVAGQLFDPACMVAVATEPDSSRPHQTVVEEVAAGYRRRGELLRAAQVKVTVNPTPK